MKVPVVVFFVVLTTTCYAQQTDRSFRFPEGGGASGLGALLGNAVRAHQGIVLGQLGDRLPESGQLLRLRGGRDINAGFVQVMGNKLTELNAFSCFRSNMRRYPPAATGTCCATPAWAATAPGASRKPLSPAGSLDTNTECCTRSMETALLGIYRKVRS